MTDEEILKEADKIRARRARAEVGRNIMCAERVEIVAWEDGHSIARVDVSQDAELAAFLCRVLECNISEGAL